MQATLSDAVEVLVAVLASIQGVLVTISLVSMMTAFGTSLTRGDVRRTIREYNLVARWILANLIVVPLFAVILGSVFGLPNSILLGLLLVAVAPGAPFIPQIVTMAGENTHEAVRLTAALTVVATMTVPLLVAGMLAVLPVDVRFSAWRFLVPLLIVLVIPLFAGALVRDRRPEVAGAVARRLMALSNGTLLLALAIVVSLNVRVTLDVFATLLGTGALLVMVLFVLASVLVGWLTGGPTPQNRRILALGTAGRNVNIALFIATSAFPATAVNASIVAFAVIMLAVSLLVAWYWRRHPQMEGSTPDEQESPGEM